MSKWGLPCLCIYLTCDSRGFAVCALIVWTGFFLSAACCLNVWWVPYVCFNGKRGGKAVDAYNFWCGCLVTTFVSTHDEFCPNVQAFVFCSTDTKTVLYEDRTLYCINESSSRTKVFKVSYLSNLKSANIWFKSENM